MNTKPRTTTRLDGKNNQLRLLLADDEMECLRTLTKLAGKKTMSDYVRGLIFQDARARGFEVS